MIIRVNLSQRIRENTKYIWKKRKYHANGFDYFFIVICFGIAVREKLEIKRNTIIPQDFFIRFIRINTSLCVKCNVKTNNVKIVIINDCTNTNLFSLKTNRIIQNNFNLRNSYKNIYALCV